MENNCLYQNLSLLEIKGLGEKTIEKLNELKISNLRELLYNFPKNYEDRTNIKRIEDLKLGEFSVVKAKVMKVDLMRTRNKKSLFKIVVSDETAFFEVIWFRMPFLKAKIKPGMTIILFGEVKRSMHLNMVNPDFHIIDAEDEAENKIEALYKLIDGLKQNNIKKLIKNAMEKYIDHFEELLDEETLKKAKVIGRKMALKKIHFPEKTKDIYIARRRFAFEELWILECGILAKRYELDMTNRKKYELEDRKNLVKKFLETLNFELTNAQKKVITEIYKDLNKGKIVNRLIQGDVGSGKTIVAVIMLLYMVENGYQGAFMAPTEILAEQHYLAIIDVFNELGVKVGILSSSLSAKKKKELLSELRHGVIKVLVGTHALIEDSVEFKNLGLIVIDEQHRFGVKQRQKLREKGILANLLVMSATPIPRSLALSIYGDLDVSVIDELPPGRIAIKTKWVKINSEKEKMYKFIETKLSQGRQAYVVCPLIEESEKMELKSATSVYEELSDRYFKYTVAILHGKMKSEEKEKIMRAFKNNKINLLVSTTVIEVGVDVPNASIMLVSDAERFGLAQLHQLRGRVGRGVHKSYCFLESESENEVTQKRLEIMEKTTDGFEIAEEDLRLRKSGEIFGTRQSGFSDLKFVDIVKDVELIKYVRDEVMNYLGNNKGEIKNIYLLEEIKNKFKENMEV